MSGVVLAASTGDENVDALLHEVISHIEQALPGRIRGYYMHEARMQGIGNPAFKLASLFLYGQDIRDDLPLVSSEEWARQLMHSMYLVTGCERGLSALTYPLDYPDPHGEFYGYDHNTKPQPDGTMTRGTRGLVTGAGWYATAMIALGTGQYVLRKRDVPDCYRQYVGDEWAPFLDTLYARCRDEWRYQLPERADDRDILRDLCDLCERYLAFENYFLSAYKDFVLSDLRGNDELAAPNVARAAALAIQRRGHADRLARHRRPWNAGVAPSGGGHASVLLR